MTATFNHAVKADYLDKSPVPAWETPEIDDEDKKPPFTDQQLVKLFTSPNYLKPPRAGKEHIFWLPIIGLLTGMRIDEICQLHISDVVCLDGIWCFRVSRQGIRKLKSKHSKRVLPIHSKLIDLGLLDHVEAMRAAGYDRLWPNLKLDAKYGRGFSTSAVTYFSRYLRDHVTAGVEGVAPTFHSLRENFTTRLKKRGVDYEKRSMLLGHTPPNVTEGAHYDGLTDAEEAALLKPAIELLDFEALRHLK